MAPGLTDVPSALEALYGQVLAATATNPSEPLLALYAPDAWLVARREPARQADRPAAGWQSLWQDDVPAAQRPSCLPEPAPLARLDIEPDRPDEAVAWFPTHGPANVAYVALGCRRTNDSWQVVWSLFAAAPKTFEPGLGEAVMLSDFPFLAHASLPPMRTFLELGWWRATVAPRPALDTMAGARFACQGSSACCRAQWAVEVPAIAQAVLDSIPWEDADADLRGQQLSAGAPGLLQLKGRNEACRYLDANKHCRIHKRLGNPIFAACSAFPYRFVETPDGVVAATSFACGTVRANLGPPLPTLVDDIQARLARAGLSHRMGAFRLANGREIEWEAFRALEGSLRDDLGNTDLPLVRRLWLGARRLEAAVFNLPEDVATWEVEAIAPHSLTDTMQDQRALALHLFARIDPVLAPVALRDAPHTPLEDTERVARFLQTVHFSKIFSYPYDLVTAHTMTILLAQMLEILAAPGVGEVPAHVWQQLGTMTLHGAFGVGLEAIHEHLPDLAAALGQPAFALALLSVE
jgi:hypothetical protein